jgi:hypothetical protein
MGELKGCAGVFLPGFRKKPRPEVKPLVRLSCHHCGTENIVAECKRCGRSYVITTAHVEGRMRGDDAAGSVSHMRAILVGYTCDACLAEHFGSVEGAAERQRTCPACREEFLSKHGL